MTVFDAKRLLAAANAFVGLSDPNGDVLPGTFAREIRRRVGKPYPGDWDVALLYHWGYWAYFDYERGASAWPLLATDSAQQLGEFAAAQGIQRIDPAVGDIYLQFAPTRQGFVRAGLVVQVIGDDPSGCGSAVITIEGNAGRFGELGGPSILRIRRTVSPRRGVACALGSSTWPEYSRPTRTSGRTCFRRR